MVGKGFFYRRLSVGFGKPVEKIKYSHADVKVDFGGEFIYFKVLV